MLTNVEGKGVSSAAGKTVRLIAGEQGEPTYSFAKTKTFNLSGCDKVHHLNGALLTQSNHPAIVDLSEDIHQM